MEGCLLDIRLYYVATRLRDVDPNCGCACPPRVHPEHTTRAKQGSSRLSNKRSGMLPFIDLHACIRTCPSQVASTQPSLTPDCRAMLGMKDGPRRGRRARHVCHAALCLVRRAADRCPQPSKASYAEVGGPASSQPHRPAGKLTRADHTWGQTRDLACGCNHPNSHLEPLLG